MKFIATSVVFVIFLNLEVIFARDKERPTLEKSVANAKHRPLKDESAIRKGQAAITEIDPDRHKVKLIDVFDVGPSEKVAELFMFDMDDQSIAREIEDPEKAVWADKLRKSTLNWVALLDIFRRLTLYIDFYKDFNRKHWDGSVDCSYPIALKYILTEDPTLQQKWYLYFSKIQFDGFGLSTIAVDHFNYWMKVDHRGVRKDYVYQLKASFHLDVSNVRVNFLVLNERKIDHDIKPGTFDAVINDIDLSAEVTLTEIDPNLEQFDKDGNRMYFCVPEIELNYKIGRIDVWQITMPERITPDSSLEPNEILKHLTKNKAGQIVIDYLNYIKNWKNPNVMDRVKWGVLNKISPSLVKAENIWSIPLKLVHDLSGIIDEDIPSRLTKEEVKEIEEEVFQVYSLQEFLSKHLREFLKIMYEELSTSEELDKNGLAVSKKKDDDYVEELISGKGLEGYS